MKAKGSYGEVHDGGDARIRRRDRPSASAIDAERGTSLPRGYAPRRPEGRVAARLARRCAGRSGGAARRADRQSESLGKPRPARPVSGGDRRRGGASNAACHPGIARRAPVPRARRRARALRRSLRAAAGAPHRVRAAPRRVRARHARRAGDHDLRRPARRPPPPRSAEGGALRPAVPAAFPVPHRALRRFSRSDAPGPRGLSGIQPVGNRTMKIFAEQDPRFQGLERKTGLFLALGAALVIGAFLAALVRQGAFTQTTHLEFFANSAQGISKGMVVQLFGFKIGAVDALSLETNGSGATAGSVRVRLQIENEYLPLI